MTKTVLFTAYCSQTRKPFLVEGTVADGVLTWNRAFTSMANTAGLATPHADLTIKFHDTSKFRCPICKTTNTFLNSRSWNCSDCGRQHCTGTENGMVLGGCGTCSHSPSSFVPTETTKISPMDRSRF